MGSAVPGKESKVPPAFQFPAFRLSRARWLPSPFPVPFFKTGRNRPARSNRLISREFFFEQQEEEREGRRFLGIQTIILYYIARKGLSFTIFPRNRDGGLKKRNIETNDSIHAIAVHESFIHVHYSFDKSFD